MPDSRTRAAARGHRGGFTLIEMLVVVGIIIVLAAILLPTLSRAWRNAQRTADANHLQSIAVALEGYRQDFGDYPRVRRDTSLAPVDYTIMRTTPEQQQRPNPQTGAEVLCFALMGLAQSVDPGPPLGTTPAGYRPMMDGADGPGFRVRAQGKVYPPYLPVDRFQFGYRDGPDSVNTDPNFVLHFSILDRNNMPILYFPKSAANPNVTQPTPMNVVKPYVDSTYANAMISSELSRYDGDDNLIWFQDDPFAAMTTPATFTTGAPKALKRIRGMMGDRQDAMSNPTPDGVIQTPETAVDLPFVLWSAGPDERFGPSPEFSTGATLTPEDIRLLERCDDVTNFPR